MTNFKDYVEESANKYFKDSYNICCELYNNLQKCKSENKKQNAMINIILELVSQSTFGNIDYTDVFGALGAITEGKMTKAIELAEKLDKEAYKEICNYVKIYEEGE